MRIVFALILFFGIFAFVSADESDLKYSVFLDTYYAYDFNQDTRKRPYFTQPYYHDEPAINLAFVDATLSNNEWRGRLAAQYGSSVDINYYAEPHDGWKYVQEAFIGRKLAPGLWLDAGILLSHIGMESWISRDNLTYTRSLIAEYSPYYQTGACLKYEANSTWSFQAHVLRGWQNISDDRNPAVGMQVQYKASEEVTFIYNNFLGNEHGSRIFNDFIGKWQVNDRLQFAAAIDIGYQRIPADNDEGWWHGWALIAQYKIAPKIAIGTRIERFFDPQGVVLAGLNDERFGAFGTSLNVDVELLPRLLWRTEYRILKDNHDVFPKGDGFDDSASFVVTSLSYTLQ